MFRSLGTMAVGIVLTLAAASVCMAQFGNRSSGMGMGMGSSRGGSAFQGGMGMGGGGMSGMGMSGMSGLGSFGSSFGNSGFGGTSFGQSGFGNSGFGGTSFGGMSGGMGGGMGGMGGQNFVGRDAGDMNAVMNQMGRAGTQFFNSMNRNMGQRNNRNRNTEPAQVENERPPVRIRLEVGFNAPKPAPSVVAANIQGRLARLAVDHSLGRPEVSVEGGTVVLRGTAETESQRQVLEKLIALEPGVLRIRNEMVVAPPPIEEVLPPAVE